MLVVPQKSTKTAMRRMQPFSTVSLFFDDCFCCKHLMSSGAMPRAIGTAGLRVNGPSHH